MENSILVYQICEDEDGNLFERKMRLCLSEVLMYSEIEMDDEFKDCTEIILKTGHEIIIDLSFEIFDKIWVDSKRDRFFFKNLN